MKIFHDQNFDSLTHDGDTFTSEATEDGHHVFDVAEHVGQELLTRVGWHHWSGKTSSTVAPAKAEELDARVKAVEDAFAGYVEAAEKRFKALEDAATKPAPDPKGADPKAGPTAKS